MFQGFKIQFKSTLCPPDIFLLQTAKKQFGFAVLALHPWMSKAAEAGIIFCDGRVSDFALKTLYKSILHRYILGLTLLWLIHPRGQKT